MIPDCILDEFHFFYKNFFLQKMDFLSAYAQVVCRGIKKDIDKWICTKPVS